MHRYTHQVISVFFLSISGQGKAILIVSRGASHFNFYFRDYFFIHPKPNMTAKSHFLYVSWHTHLPRFHGEQPYAGESKVKVFVSSGT